MFLKVIEFQHFRIVVTTL